MVGQEERSQEVGIYVYIQLIHIIVPQKLARHSKAAMCVCVARSLHSCLTLCDPMDCSPLGSFVHWILQARILEWISMLFSRGSS